MYSATLAIYFSQLVDTRIVNRVSSSHLITCAILELTNWFQHVDSPGHSIPLRVSLLIQLINIHLVDTIDSDAPNSINKEANSK